MLSTGHNKCHPGLSLSHAALFNQPIYNASTDDLSPAILDTPAPRRALPPSRVLLIASALRPHTISHSSSTILDIVRCHGQETEPRIQYKDVQAPQSVKSRWISKQWHDMPDEKKAYWHAMARQEKLKHEEKYPDYKFQPQSKEQKAAKKEERLRVKAEEKREEKRRKTSETTSVPSGNHTTYEAAALAHSTIPVTPPNRYPPSPLASEAPALTPGSNASSSQLPSAAASPPPAFNVPEPQWLDGSLDPAMGTDLGLPLGAPNATDETYLDALNFAPGHKRPYDVMQEGSASASDDMLQQYLPFDTSSTTSGSIEDLIGSLVQGYPVADIFDFEPSEQSLWNTQLMATMPQPPADPYSQFFSTDDFLTDAVGADATSSWSDVPAEEQSAFVFGSDNYADFQPETFVPHGAPLFNVDAALATQSQDNFGSLELSAYTESGSSSLPVPPAHPAPASAQPEQQQQYLPPPGASVAGRRRVGSTWPQTLPEFVVGSSSRPFGS
ncbi:hypothetical protein EIP91_008197 [Steccherinum ochraceum]|uniref:HMG box domain-containing protein n=1 Tax=Steccherinum ochraceum TaxID=92696 RepID=A0A4R0RQ13_9APHY|nr:hypothetical protein EIP91_008197 [Steccherinum ochraceum]